MATRLEGMTVTTGGWRRSHSALRLAVDAARQTLERTGRTPDQIPLLIYTGLFRDRNLGEPALAPMIQEDLGANPEDPHSGRRGTFSFDISNGGGGVLSALEVADRFLRAGTVDVVLVVSSDANPGHGLAPGFPFDPAGGAVLCTRSDGPGGLGAFSWATDPDDGSSFRATVGERTGSNVLTIHHATDYAERAGRVAAAAVQRLFDQESLKPIDVDVVVASPNDDGFRQVFGDEVGIEDERIVSAGARLHTVSFLAGLETAVTSGRLARSRKALFVCASAGVTAGAVLFTP